MSNIAKGQKLPLLFTVKGRQRIVVAISWDVKAKKTTFVDKLTGKDQQHDLDISCFVYDENGDYIDFVGPMAQDSMDQTGCIYHSGDDATGEGSGDDEFISIELAGLPRETDQIMFVTEIRSDHVFSEVDAPSMRIADGMTNYDLHEYEMAKGVGRSSNACVMGRIFRHLGSPTGWGVQIIDEYPHLDDVSDWGSYLQRYL